MKRTGDRGPILIVDGNDGLRILEPSEATEALILIHERRRMLLEQRPFLLQSPSLELPQPRLELDMSVNITIFIKPDVGDKTQLKASLNKAGYAHVQTTDLLFADIAKTDLAKDFDLKRWELKRSRERWNGLPADKSPSILDGDTVTFFVRKKAS